MHLPRLALLFFSGIGLCYAGTAAAAPAEPDHITAVWQRQSLEFAYRGTTTAYSCSTLQRRLEAILRSVGARDGIPS